MVSFSARLLMHLFPLERRAGEVAGYRVQLGPRGRYQSRRWATALSARNLLDVPLYQSLTYKRTARALEII